MPERSKRPCRQPGCPGTHRNASGYCDAHADKARAYDRSRPSAAGRGYDRIWAAARTWYLRENPLCVVCQAEGHTRTATVVDHITPHKGDQVIFWDRSRWQALCKHHHDAKTDSEAYRGPQGVWE